MNIAHLHISFLFSNNNNEFLLDSIILPLNYLPERLVHHIKDLLLTSLLSPFQFFSIIDILCDILLINNLELKCLQQVDVGIYLSFFKVISKDEIPTGMQMIFTISQNFE